MKHPQIIIMRLLKAEIIAIFFVLVSCSPARKNNLEYIVYGTYAGECLSHCATMYKLEKDKLLVDTTDSFFDNYCKSITFRGDTLSKNEFLKAQELKLNLPELLLTSESKQFGSPDSRDQGGIFAQIKCNSEIKTFYIDTDLDDIPEELRNYANLIMKTTGFKQ